MKSNMLQLYNLRLFSIVSCLLVCLIVASGSSALLNINPIERERRQDNNPDNQQQNDSSSNQMHILGLFSGTSNDLGIDHRLGRQVLKLATDRARQLYPEIDVKLTIINDDTDCGSLNAIPNQVAERFYSPSMNQRVEDRYCTLLVPEVCSREEFDSRELDEYLNRTIQNKHRLRRQPVLHRGHSLAHRVESRFKTNKKQIDAIIGPSCDYLVDLIARMASYWRTPMYSVTSIGSSFSRKYIYTTLTRLSPSIDHLSMFVLKTLEKFRWKHLAIIIDTNQIENRLLLENFERISNKMNHLIPTERKVFTFKSFLSNVSVDEQQVVRAQNEHATSGTSSACTDEARKLLLDARRVARVILLLLNSPHTIRRLLICAHEIHMNNGQFTFLSLNLGLKSSSSQVQVTTPASFVSASSDEKTDKTQEMETANSFQPPTASSQRMSQSSSSWFSVDDEANNAKAKEMFESLIVFSVELPIGDTLSLFIEQSLDLAHQAYPSVRFERSSVNAVAVALHDSLLLAVHAHLNHLKNRNTSFHKSNIEEQKIIGKNLDSRYEEADATLIQTPLMWNQHYSDGLMSGMHINSNGDQELDYVLSDLEPELAVMRPVASYSKEKRELQFLAETYIHWPKRVNAMTKELIDNDEPPPDEPECGFNEDSDQCVDKQNLHAALSIVGILLLLILIGTLASLHKYREIRYQMQLDDYWWKINWVDLKFIQMTEESLSTNARSVARGIKLEAAANSVISLGSDGVGSVVSGDRANSKISTTTLSIKKPDGKPGFGLRQQRSRRAAVPTIITSDLSTEKPLRSKVASDRFDLVSQSGRSSLGSKAASVIEGSCLIRSELSSVIRASNLAFYRKELVIVKQLNASNLDISRELLVELKSMRMYINDNLAKFIGLCVEPERLSIVYEYCSRGSLYDLLQNDTVAMDLTLKYSIIGDLVNGLSFIHSTLLDYHGRLKSTNCVLDSRFTVKITDFGLQNLYSQLDAIKDQEVDQNEDEVEDGEDVDESDQKELRNSKQKGKIRKPKIQHDQLSLSVSQAAYNMESVSVRGDTYGGPSGERRVFLKNRGAARFFWTAPEHLRDKNIHFAASKKGDVFSLAIILYEIFTRKEPYYYGTNAKPFWPAIKHDKNQHFSQQQTQTLAPLVSINRRTSRSDTLTHGGGSLVSSFVSRQSKRAQIKLKRTGATVEPDMTRSPSFDKPGLQRQQRLSNDNVSIKSGQSGSSRASVVDPVASVLAPSSIQSTKHKMSPVLNVSSINEEDNTVTSDLRSTAKSAGGNSNASDTKVDAEEILDQLRMGIQPEPIRPYLPNYVLQDINPKLIELLRTCWAESPTLRPTMAQVRNSLRRITRGVASKNYLDNLLERLQNYAENLERIVDGKSSDIIQEKMRTEELLYQLVPKFVADRLKRDEPIVPQVFDGVTIFFSDIVGFEKYSSVMSPVELVDLLNNIYSSFDSIISSFDVTKIETIIDQFLVASGICLQSESKPPGRLVSNEIQSNTIQGTKKTEILDSTVKEKDMHEESDERKKNCKGRKGRLGILSSIRRGHSEKTKKEHSLDNSSLEDTEKHNPVTSGTHNIPLSPNEHDQASANIQATSELEHYKRTSAEQLARMALCIRDLVKSFHFRQNLNQNTSLTTRKNEELSTESVAPVSNMIGATFNIRIGMHSGKVCAGIVGVKRPKFCLIGDTVNVASRMHTNSKANRIQISEDTKQLLELVPGFNIEPRGKIEVKGKGMMETYWLESY